MITIIKRNPPAYLTPIHIRQRNNPLPNAFNTDAEFSQVKPNVKQDLLEDQGNICCFCMARISSEDMKIAHRLSQKNHPECVFDYRNLFAACNGNQGQPHEKEHCDTFQGDNDLTIDLTRPDLTELIYYNLNAGEIHSSLPEYERDITETLNLNVDVLKQKRIMVYRGVQRGLAKQHHNAWSVAVLQRKVNHLRSKPYEPYFQVQVFYLEREIEKRAGNPRR